MLRWVWDAENVCFLRWERNWVLESESDKEEDWLVAAALGGVLEKVLIDFGKLFQRIGAVRLYEGLDIWTEEVVDVDDWKKEWSQQV